MHGEVPRNRLQKPCWGEETDGEQFGKLVEGPGNRLSVSYVSQQIKWG